jgi:hypothetical protein
LYSMKLGEGEGECHIIVTQAVLIAIFPPFLGRFIGFQTTKSIYFSMPELFHSLPAGFITIDLDCLQFIKAYK